MIADPQHDQPPPLRPLQRDGIAEFIIGSAAFALVSVVLIVGREAFDAPDWWLQVTLTGLGVGSFATGYCWWRRDRTAPPRDAQQS